MGANNRAAGVRICLEAWKIESWATTIHRMALSLVVIAAAGHVNSQAAYVI